MSIDNTAHFVMQSKGGAGKSLCSMLLAQYLNEKDSTLKIIDTGPFHYTLEKYEALNVENIKSLNKRGNLDQKVFDKLINKFLSNKSPMLVDTSSADFLSINNYIIENEIPHIFSSNNKNLIIHCPVNYGTNRIETFRCLTDIIINYKDTPIIVWENEFFGENENNFIDTTLFNQAKNVIGVIKIRKMSIDKENCNFSKMLEDYLTFKEVSESEDNNNYGFMQKIRLEHLKNEIWGQLDLVVSLK